MRDTVKFVLWVGALLSVFVVFPITAQAGDYYVAPTGSNTTGDGSSGNPWKTITYAMSHSGSGDTVHLAPGTYSPTATGETFPIQMSSGRTLLGDSGAANTIVDAQAIETLIVKRVVRMSGGTLDGLTIRGGYALESDYSGRGGGIYITGKTSIVRNCIITWNECEQWGAGIYVTGTGDWDELPQPQIINCTIFDNGKCWAAGMCQYGGGICCNGSSPRIINCTITRNRALIQGSGLFVSNTANWANPRLTNTIIRDNDGAWCSIDGWGEGEGAWLYNCDWDFERCWISNIHDEGGNINVDPQFVGGGDYHLQETSPCKDAGRATHPEAPTFSLPGNDIDGDSRPYGSGYDIGSDEFAPPPPCVDTDEDGYGVCPDCGMANGCVHDGNDCNDGDPGINPGATEILCNGIDEDCSGADNCGCVDNDGDGYGVCPDCDMANGCVHDGDDCNDTPGSGASVYPGAAEVSCDGIDQDCSGLDYCCVDADEDGYGVCPACGTANGCTHDGDDCNDGDPNIYPGAVGMPCTAHGNPSDGVNRSSAACGYWPGGVCTIGSCAHCHETFDSDICGVNEQMLFYPLDGFGGDGDFCMECHVDSGSLQVGGVPAPAGNISDAFAKTYKHNVLGYSGIHRFWPASPPAKTSEEVEDRTYLSSHKHVECNDCHNPHLARAGLHSSNEVHVSSGTNLIADSGPATGAFGVEPETWSTSNWGGVTTWPSTSSTAEKEYQICFKCHADYNTNFSSWGGSGAASWTNVALEFNPNNRSYHPVVQALPETELGDDGSIRLAPALTSLVIGDSGVKTGGSATQISDSTKGSYPWIANQWQDWGVRFGTTDQLPAHYVSSHNAIRNITSNGGSSLSLNSSVENLPDSSTVYSIEYYAGGGADISGKTVTHNIKNFNLYLPSLVGYTVVIQEDIGGSNETVDWVARGTVTSNTATSFTVEAWIGLTGSVPSSGTGIVAYYFSATGHSMMCSDCHGNDTISSTAAQGPHGSAVKWMLKGRNRAWPLASAASNGAGDDGTDPYAVHYGVDQAPRYENDGNPNGNGLFCLNCHSTVGFSKNAIGLSAEGPYNVHVLHNAACVNCHITVPHGGSLSRLIGDGANGDAPLGPSDMPVRYAFDDDLSNIWVTRFSRSTEGAAGYGSSPGDGDAYCSVSCGHHPENDWGEDW